MDKPAAEPGGTLVEVMFARLRTNSAHPACHFVSGDGAAEQSLTYGELLDRARGIGTWLEQHSETGARVLLLCPPGLSFITAFLGCLCVGRVAVPASAPHPRRLDRDWPRLKALLKDCGASVVICSEELAGPLKALLRSETDISTICVQTTEELDACRAAPENWERPRVSGDDLALLQYTSGSTRTPRGVMISQRNLLANLQFIHEVFETNAATVGVFWLPFHHDMGLIGGILQTFYCGGESTFCSPLAFIHRPARWLQLISERRATISGGPNFAYEECVRRVPPGVRSALDLSSWELAFCGAEPIHAETLEQFAETFAESGFRREALFPCYGLAESTLLVTGGAKGSSLVIDRKPPSDDLNDAEFSQHRERVGCGFARPGQRVWIVSPETRLRCGEREIGEVWVEGASVGQGYWGRPTETEAIFRAHTAAGEGPFLRTGDLGYFSGSELFIVGRLKDLMIFHGQNHFPQDIEWTVESCHPAVRQHACVAFSVEQGQGEQLIVVAEIEQRMRNRSAIDQVDSTAHDVNQVKEVIRRAVTEQHGITPSEVALTKAFAIPRTSSGKLQRRACRDLFLTGQLTDVAGGRAIRERGTGQGVAAES